MSNVIFKLVAWQSIDIKVCPEAPQALIKLRFLHQWSNNWLKMQRFISIVLTNQY